MQIKEEWAKSIMGQALAEIRTVADIPIVMEKVRGTAIGLREDLMSAFLDLVELKKEIIAR